MQVFKSFFFFFNFCKEMEDKKTKLKQARKLSYAVTIDKSLYVSIKNFKIKRNCILMKRISRRLLPHIYLLKNSAKALIVPQLWIVLRIPLNFSTQTLQILGSWQNQQSILTTAYFLLICSLQKPTPAMCKKEKRAELY